LWLTIFLLNNYRRNIIGYIIENTSYPKILVPKFIHVNCIIDIEGGGEYGEYN
jgi:hypothetical protein